MAWSLGFDADFQARRMGTSEVTWRTNGLRDGCRLKFIDMRPLFGLRPALVWRAAVEPTAALVAQGFLTDAAAIQVETVEAATAAKRMVIVIDGVLQFLPTTGITTTLAPRRLPL